MEFAIIVYETWTLDGGQKEKMILLNYECGEE